MTVEVLGLGAPRGALDADDAATLAAEAVERVRRAVERHGGTVQPVDETLVRAWFAPKASHEDETARAALAGSLLISSVDDLARDIARAWQVDGIASRAAIATAGEDERARETIAARADALRRRGAPGELLADGATARRLARRHRLEELDDGAWRIGTRRRVSSSDFPSMPLVGREAELRRGAGMLDDLALGRGGILLLRGETGVGKTRLVTELVSRAGHGISCLDGACPAFGGGPYEAFADMLRGWLGLGQDATAIAIRTRLRARLAACGGDELAAPLGALLALTGVDREAAVSPALLAWIRLLALRGPIVVVLEDAQWLDASSRELAEQLLALTDELPVAILVTLRTDAGPEGAALRLAALGGFAHRTHEIAIEPLDTDGARTLVRCLLPGALDEAAEDIVLERAEGNPLFLEELLRALAESRGLERRRSWTITPIGVELPPLLESLLAARIDGLPADARDVVRAAAALGRRFAVRVVARVVGADRTAGAMPILLRGEIVRESSRAPDLECSFHHGLLQDAALATLDLEERRALYSRVAQAYELEYGDELEQHAEALAFYHAQGEDPAAALGHLSAARTQAMRLGARDRAALLDRRIAALRSRVAAPAGDGRALAAVP
jgi:hypothetical protein